VCSKWPHKQPGSHTHALYNAGHQPISYHRNFLEKPAKWHLEIQYKRVMCHMYDMSGNFHMRTQSSGDEIFLNDPRKLAKHKYKVTVSCPF